jgi:cellulose synthase/poly-beta-1,6-N-acetylglucosamine synthase-like glycosyltransferase
MSPVPATAVSVVIPSRNGKGRLPALLSALARQRLDRPWEVIVVEDGSSEISTEALAGLPGARLVRQPQGGPGSARNRGAALASGEVVVFVDDDCEPAPDWLPEMLRPFEDERVVGVKGAYVTEQTSVVARFVQAEYEEKFARLARKRFVNFVDGFSAAFRSSAFSAAGGFDESFPQASVEDREFSLRLSKGRGCLVFNPWAVVAHRHVASFWGYLAKKFKYGRWGVQILRRMPAGFVGDDHTPHSQRLQVLLMATLPPVLVAAAAWKGGLLAAWAALFWGSALPLLARAWRHGWRVGLATVPLVFLRALGLVAGLACGTLASVWERARARNPRASLGTDRTNLGTDDVAPTSH